MKGSRGIGFIELVEFLGFIELMKRKRVEDSIPTAISNTINPKNTMNKATKRMNIHQAFISVGSNLGDKIENCRKGTKGLLADGRAALVKSSLFYRTSPVDYEDQDWFVNRVLKIETTLGPFELLDKIRGVEKAVGRKANTVRFGPRVLDLDIIFFDDQVVQTDTLEIPHPRMHKRRFVLKPICDIEPSMVHPLLGKNMRSLLDGLKDSEQRIVEIQ